MIRFPITDNFSAYRALEALSEAFGIPCPKLRWSPRATRGLYSIKPSTGLEEASISLGPKSWRGIENSLVHEFAHHLDQSRRGKSDHSAPFQQALWEVVQVWFGNPELYSWRTEYASVRAAGPKKPLDIDQLLNEIKLD